MYVEEWEGYVSSIKQGGGGSPWCNWTVAPSPHKDQGQAGPFRPSLHYTDSSRYVFI